MNVQRSKNWLQRPISREERYVFNAHQVYPIQCERVVREASFERRTLVQRQKTQEREYSVLGICALGVWTAYEEIVEWLREAWVSIEVSFNDE